MKSSLRMLGFCFATLVVFAAVSPRSYGQESPKSSPDPAPVLAALNRVDAWLGAGENAQRWRRFVGIPALRTEVPKGPQANTAPITEALQRLASKAPGLELKPFAQLRDALSDFRRQLSAQGTPDFASLAAAVSDDRQPLTPEQFVQIRETMRDRAGALEQAWGGPNTSLAHGWKKFLLWDQLEPNFADDFEITRGSLMKLDEVLLRFRSNQPGLELPVFTDAARAIAHYRALATWATASKSRDIRADYGELLKQIAVDLQRHFENPTTETAWKAGRILGVIDNLGHSADFVRTVRDRFAQKNIIGFASARVLENLPNRDFSQVRPVRDCILGTSIFGSAQTMGNIRYELIPSDDSIQLMVHLTGRANSRTNGYNGPVRINSHGNTSYAASKRLSFSDVAFEADPAVAEVDTRTQIKSIQKTGGQFAANLIEKVAWKRAMESKRQAERISAAHTRENVIDEFNERVAKDLGDARLRYQTRVRDPLTRRAVTPEYLHMSSSPNGIEIETTFAARYQLAANQGPPVPKPGHDLLLQVHESAVNNYLPLALASARISQETAEQAPDLQGDVPNWIKVLSVKKPQLAGVAATGAAVVNKAAETIDQVVEGEADERGPNDPPALPPFRPYSITLNSEAPAGVHFDDGKAVIRVRASKLYSDDVEYSNWDFIITYAVTQDNDRILLKRVGDIEVFPTGFDPAWDKQLTAQQSGFRSTLAKNINARANAGESFPKEIPIDPIRVASVGTLLLNEIKVDDGWLTVGWILPPPAAP